MEEEADHMSVYANGQVSTGQTETLQQQTSILRVTVTDKLQEESPVVVVKKTVSLHNPAIIVNGVSSKSKQSMKDNLAEEMEKIPVLLPMTAPDHPAVPADDEQVEESELIAVEKKRVSLHMEPIFDPGVADGNEKEEIPGEAPLSEEAEPTDEGSKLQEPIEEAFAVAVESEPRLRDYHPMLEETEEDKNVDKNVDGDSVEVEYEPAATKPAEEETEAETRETIEEESPLVVEKRPVSLHMEAVVGHQEDDIGPIEEATHELVEKRPVSLHMEQVFNEEGDAEVREPIEEASSVAVEHEPRSCDYHPMLEEAVEDESVDKNVDDDSVVVEYEPAATKLKEEETETGTRETIEEESPLVVEKRPVSLHMEAVVDHKEDDREPIEEAPHEIVEKRPVSLHIEQVFNEEGSNEVREPIEEASAVAVESEPRSCDYHPMLEEAAEDENVEDTDSVKVEYEPAALNPKEEESETGTKETIEEESPLVVEKRPVSLHMEAVVDKEQIEEPPHEIVEKRPVSLHMEHVFNEEGDAEVRESIEEASAVAVESEPRSCDYHPILEEAVEDENVKDTVSVEVEYEPAALKPKEEESETGTKETIEEESPLVVEKRSVSLHMEAVVDREQIEEPPHEIVEKRPVSLHMEHVFNEEGDAEVPEPIEEASAVAVESEPRSCDYHPMLEDAVEDENVEDTDSVEVEYEPAATKPKEEETDTGTKETIEEESPLVVEKRPLSLHMEAVVDHKEDDKEPIEEAPHEIVEKRPVSLHMEHVFHEEGSNEVREPIKEASTVAVQSEPKLSHYHPMLEETAEDKNIDYNTVEVEYEPVASKAPQDTETEKGETIEEESPLVVEKRPVSLHMEAVFDPKEDREEREPIKEAPPVVVEKTPAVSLHVDDVPDEAPEKEVHDEQVTDLKELVTETELVVVEKKPASLQTKVLFDEGGPEDEPVEETKKDSDATVESLLVNIKSIIDTPATQNTEENEGKDKEPIEEGVPVVVEKRPVSLNIEPVFDTEETASTVEKAAPVEDANSVPQDKGEIVHEVVTDVVEKKPVSFALHSEQPKESDENESADKEESLLVDILEIPEVEKKMAVEDSVQETVAPAVERNTPEFHHELLQTVETEDQKPEVTAKEMDEEKNQVRETEILDDKVRGPVQKEQETQQEIQRTEVFTTTITINQKTGEDQATQELDTNVVKTIYEKKTVEVTTESTSSVPETTTTKETFTSTSFTKLQHGRDDDEQLLRHVLRKRLSAPEVLPEKENDGSAPLAASEDRGILESQEQFSFAENSRKKDSTPTKTPQMPSDVPSGTEPYEDVPDEEKLISDASGEAVVGVADSDEKPNEGADETLPVLVLLTPEEEDKSELEKERKKGKKGGLSSPQCKCCSLM
ncbi:uncharacterized protein LOC144644541 [Oculina patagonica]